MRSAEKGIEGIEFMLRLMEGREEEAKREDVLEVMLRLNRHYYYWIERMAECCVIHAFDDNSVVASRCCMEAYFMIA